MLQVHSSSKMSLSLRPAIHSVLYCMFLYYILSSNLSSDYTVQQARPIQFGLESLHNVSGCLCLHAPLCIKMIMFFIFYAQCYNESKIVSILPVGAFPGGE